MSFFNEFELERYSRQLPLIGKEGQKRLKSSCVLIAGIGGLGCWSALLLTEMGIGTLRLVDRDVVEISNLHRQPLYTENDLDYPKAEIAANHLALRNSKVKFEPVATNIDEKSASRLLEGVDVLVDGLDSLKARSALNKACIAKGVPYIFAGATARSSNISTFLSDRESPCLSCLYEGVDESMLPTCETVGIHPAILPIAAGIQISEVVRLLTHQKLRLVNKLLFINIESLSFDTITINRRPDCSVCSNIQASNEVIPPQTHITELCGKDAFMVRPKEPIIIDLEASLRKISSRFTIKTSSKLGITFEIKEGVIVSLMRGGNALIRGIKSKKESLDVYNESLELSTVEKLED
ncbi:MAG: ThiF family adenylyltransferase [Candidatus Hodarchaeota archaeon]